MPDTLRAQVDAVVEANRAARAELLGAIDALSADQRREVWFGTWSLHEIMAHVTAWQDGLAIALEQMLAGERPVIPWFDPSIEDGNATDRFNAAVVEGATNKPWEVIMSALRAARERHEAVVDRIPDTLDADRFTEGRTARRLAAASIHDREHIEAIIQWRGSKRYRS